MLILFFWCVISVVVWHIPIQNALWELSSHFLGSFQEAVWNPWKLRCIWLNEFWPAICQTSTVYGSTVGSTVYGCEWEVCKIRTGEQPLPLVQLGRIFVAKDEFMRANAAKALGFLAFGCIWHNWFWFLMIFVFLYFVLSLLSVACPVQAQGVPSRSPESWRKAQRSRGFAVLPRVRCSKHLKTRKKAETGKFWGCRGAPITLLPALEAHRHGTLPNANADGGDLLCSQRKEMQLQVQPVQPFWGENHSIFWKVWHPHPGHVNRTALCKPKDVIGSNVKCDNEMALPYETKMHWLDHRKSMKICLGAGSVDKKTGEVTFDPANKVPLAETIFTSVLSSRLRQTVLEPFFCLHSDSFWIFSRHLKTSQDVSRHLKT